MPINSPPDYDLPDRVVVTAPAELRALADPVRSTILDLVLERAATVTELATALGRPKSTVAHHVGVLVKAGMLKVVRTRRVRAIEERYYGRTAREFAVGVLNLSGPPTWDNELGVAAAESAGAHDADRLFTFLRHARIRRLPWWTLVYAAWWVGMLAFLGPHTGALFPAVAAYGLVLAGTAATSARCHPIVATGGAFFLASDTILAFRLFLPDAMPDWTSPAVMLTYTLGQGLIVFGILRTLTTAEEPAR